MKGTLIASIIAVALIVGAVILSQDTNPGSADSTPKQNVTIEDGVQVITIDARGGYSPRNTVAQAGIPTIIRMNTQGTFDCSSAIVIPDLNYQNNLPMTGTTDIPVAPQESGSRLQGLCSMGMYNFTVDFK